MTIKQDEERFSEQWLLRGIKLNGEIKALKQARQNAFRLACMSGGGGMGERVQVSAKNRTEQRYLALAEYDFMISDRIDTLFGVLEEISLAIAAVPDVVLRTLLVNRYINCMAWHEVASDMNYDIRHIHRLHKKALESIKNQHA